MGLGVCQICINKDFVYKFKPDIYPYFLFCDKCRKKLLVEHYYLLHEFHYLFLYEIKYPEFKIGLIKKRLIFAKKLKELIYQ